MITKIEANAAAAKQLQDEIAALKAVNAAEIDSLKKKNDEALKNQATASSAEIKALKN